MKYLLFVLMIAYVVVVPSAGQASVFESRAFGFSMKAPVGWQPLSEVEVAQNLEGLDLDLKVREKLLLEQGRILLFAYSKQKPGTIDGIIPKIEARVISNGLGRILTFGEFKPAAISAMKRFAVNYETYEYVIEPSETLVSGVRAVYQITKFRLKAGRGDSHSVRSRTYFIPYQTWFFQISFSDDPKNNDCSALFDELIRSIRIGK